MSLACVFPGQGSQSVGMLASLSDVHPVFRATFDEASEVLGYDAWAMTQEGPAEALNATVNTQPLLLAAGVAVWRTFRALGGPPVSAMAGHSLGEFSALVCAGSLQFRDSVELVRQRGRFMQEAVPTGEGAMAAILGLDDSDVEAACREAAGEGIAVAVNYNSPGQVVIAGDTAAVERAIQACKARGAKRAVALPVSVPSHSPLMQPAADRFRALLADADIRPPENPVYAFDGSLYSGPESIREGLYRQLFNPVRWSTIGGHLISMGVRVVIEAGPGKVLAGLMRRLDGGRDLQILAIDGAEALQAALDATGKGE